MKRDLKEKEKNNGKNLEDVKQSLDFSNSSVVG